MSAYSKSTGFKLYIGASTAIPLPAPGSDTFVAIGELQNFTPPPSSQAVKPYYVLNDGSPRAIGGRLDDRVVDGVIVLDWSITEHGLLETDAATPGGVKRNYYVLYPDAGARRYDFQGICNSFKPDKADASSSGDPHTAAIIITLSGTMTITP